MLKFGTNHINCWYALYTFFYIQRLGWKLAKGNQGENAMTSPAARDILDSLPL
jgi:hypothetical protein